MNEPRTLSDLIPKPPFQPPKRLDRDCEKTIADYLTLKYGSVTYPVSTDALVCLVEEHVEDFDSSADMREYGDNVEGITIFQPGRKPKVKICASLSATRNDHRFRTTLAHEFGHVYLHDPLFQERFGQTSLTDQSPSAVQISLRGEETRPHDFIEAQAWYVCGAILMPITPLRSLLDEQKERANVYSGVYQYSSFGLHLRDLAAEAFDVSRDAARIRLLRIGCLSETEPPPGLFS